MPQRELERWLGLMQEVELLQLPLVFGRAHANVTLSEGLTVATKTSGATSWTTYRTAATEAVSGRGAISRSSRWCRATPCCLA